MRQIRHIFEFIPTSCINLMTALGQLFRRLDSRTLFSWFASDSILFLLLVRLGSILAGFYCLPAVCGALFAAAVRRWWALHKRHVIMFRVWDQKLLLFIAVNSWEMRATGIQTQKSRPEYRALLILRSASALIGHGSAHRSSSRTSCWDLSLSI